MLALPLPALGLAWRCRVEAAGGLRLVLPCASAVQNEALAPLHREPGGYKV